MARPTDADLVAAFLAKGGKVQTAEAAPAYGVDKAADKATRERREYEAAERRAERYAEETREAYHVGGSRARDEVVNRWLY